MAKRNKEEIEQPVEEYVFTVKMNITEIEAAEILIQQTKALVRLTSIFEKMVIRSKSGS